MCVPLLRTPAPPRVCHPPPRTVPAAAVQRSAAAVLSSGLRAAMGAGCPPLVVPGARHPRWWDPARTGGAQRSPLSSAAPSAALAGAKNPGQRARKKPEYQIPQWTAPPKRIIAAAVVERLPVITPDPEPWETAMWELQERKQAAMAKPLPDDWFRDDSGGLRKAEEEEGVEEADPTLGFAPRTTEADASNDTKSLERKLAKRCVRFCAYARARVRLQHTVSPLQARKRARTNTHTHTHTHTHTAPGYSWW